VGLRGGLNTFGYVGGNPVKRRDMLGLFSFDEHYFMTIMAMNGVSCSKLSKFGLAWDTMMVDVGTQDPEDSYMHSMCMPSRDEPHSISFRDNYIPYNLGSCTQQRLANDITLIRLICAGRDPAPN
jgi:hypothetical protein